MTYILDAYLYMNKSNPFTKNVKYESCEASLIEPIQNDSANEKFFDQILDALAGINDDTMTHMSKQTICDLQKHVTEQKLIANQISSWLDEATIKKLRRYNNN